jgi:hypothetical protein
MRWRTGIVRGLVCAAIGAGTTGLLCLHAGSAWSQSAAEASSPEAAPAPGKVKLVYTLGKNTGTCDDEAMFRKLLAGEMEQKDPFALTGSATHVLHLEIENESPGFRVLAALRDAQGSIVMKREFVERTCPDAVDRAVVVALLQIFPAAPVPSQAPPPAIPAPPQPPDVKSDARTDAKLAALQSEIDALKARAGALQKAFDDRKTPKMDLTYAISAGALMTANLTSNVGPGAWLGGELRAGPFSLGLETRVVFPAEVTVAPFNFDLSQFTALLVPCGRYMYFFGCVVGAGGMEFLRDSNSGPPEGLSGFAEMLQLGGRLGAEVPFADNRLAARIWAELLYTTPGHGVEYDVDIKWVRPDVSAFFGAGLVVKFGDEATR